MRPETDKRIPGEPGVWILILGELAIFSAFFVVILTMRNQDPATFLQSQAKLNHAIGLANTLLLLTSSLAVAVGCHRALTERSRPAGFMIVAITFGIGFVALKLLEYGEKISAGISLFTNEFYLYYFVFTGIHLMHVLIGVAFLTAMSEAIRRGHAPRHATWIECGALFWHLVDLLWLVLFALFYLVK